MKGVPEGVQRIICTTNAMDALHPGLRRPARARGHFPGHEAARRLLYPVLNRPAMVWKRPPGGWSEAKTEVPDMAGDRVASQYREKRPARSRSGNSLTIAT